MKNIFKIVLFSSLMFFTSCEDELDINTDPNSPPEVNRGLVLASAQASLITVVGGDLMNLGGFYAQYHTQAPSASQYENIDQYNLNTGYADRLWTELYAGCLNDLKYVIDESNADGDTGTALMGITLRAYTFQLLVDVFDDVPFTEALQGSGNISPQVTSGEEIYSALLGEIDAALAAYEANPSPSEVGTQDAIFQANMNHWIRFANTLKLKMYMRMSYTSMANPAAVNALIAENNFLTTDASFAIFGTSLNQRHPFYEVQIATTGLGDVNNIASSSIHEFYTQNGDPRLTAAFRRNLAGSYASLPQGAGAELAGVQARNYSRPNIGPQTPVYLMTVAESNFLQAEALIRYAGGAGAKEKYDAGVIASFTTYKSDFGFQNADGTVNTASGPALAQPFIAAGGAYEYTDAGSVEANVRQVMIQKWAALTYINNIEAYIETTRTKFPEVVAEGTENYEEGNRIPSRISIFAGLAVPSIMFYPEDEVNRNPNITQRASLTEKVWWDQKNN
ncbi:MAG: SusD/RagB family nutrient-binding outer membrane lipoprotein [Flavobacterium sp.]|nr:SusD/RagB family nutrient-binding outer membrane lipoprotein [Flavobacterium sp.]